MNWFLRQVGADEYQVEVTRSMCITLLDTPQFLACIVACMLSRASDSPQKSAVYLIIATGCGVFILLTSLAMLTYAGGSVDNHAAKGYSFTH